MGIIGVHALLYTSEPESVRQILRDVFGWDHVDAGGGWLIFALPPAELAVHPGAGEGFDRGVRHELSFMCDDLAATVADLRARGVEVRGEPQEARWGMTTIVVLPGDLEVMLYEPRHPTAI
jgi:catechol 2,3-dioxygenase-like lactoylglutathione lyase family enzyme